MIITIIILSIWVILLTIFLVIKLKLINKVIQSEINKINDMVLLVKKLVIEYNNITSTIKLVSKSHKDNSKSVTKLLSDYDSRLTQIQQTLVQKYNIINKEINILSNSINKIKSQLTILKDVKLLSISVDKLKSQITTIKKGVPSNVKSKAV